MQICFKKWLNYLTLCLVISYLPGQKTAPILESLNMFAAMKGHEHGDPMIATWVTGSVTRLVDFWKFLATNCLF